MCVSRGSSQRRRGGGPFRRLWPQDDVSNVGNGMKVSWDAPEVWVTGDKVQTLGGGVKVKTLNKVLRWLGGLQQWDGGAPEDSVMVGGWEEVLPRPGGKGHGSGPRALDKGSYSCHLRETESLEG